MENLTIENVAKYARLWGICSLISGVLVLIMGIVITIAAGAVAAAAHATDGPMSNPAALGAIGVALIPTALVSIIGGFFYLKSGAALRSVVQTQGDDIRLMMDAIRSLTTALKIEAIAMAVGFVLGLVIGIVGRAGGAS
jgi:hypothetical protein